MMGMFVMMTVLVAVIVISITTVVVRRMLMVVESAPSHARSLGRFKFKQAQSSPWFQTLAQMAHDLRDVGRVVQHKRNEHHVKLFLVRSSNLRAVRLGQVQQLNVVAAVVVEFPFQLMQHILRNIRRHHSIVLSNSSCQFQRDIARAAAKIQNGQAVAAVPPIQRLELAEHGVGKVPSRRVIVVVCRSGPVEFHLFRVVACLFGRHLFDIVVVDLYSVGVRLLLWCEVFPSWKTTAAVCVVV